MDLTQFGGTEVIVVKGAHGPLEIRGATTRYGVVESLGRVDVCSLNERTSINLREPSEIQVPAGGRLELGDVQGPLQLQAVRRDVSASVVNGPLQARDVGGDIELGGPINGPLRIRGARKLSGSKAAPIRGDATLANLTEVDIAQVNGNLAIRQVSGMVRLVEVNGHTRAANVAGGLHVDSIEGNLLLEGRFTGNATWEARVKGRTRLRLHRKSSVRLELEAENQPPSLDPEFQIVERSERRIVATLGNGEGRIAIRAEGPISAKVGGSADGDNEYTDAFAKAGVAVERAMAEMTSALDAAFEGVGAELAGVGADLDLGGLGERVSTRVRHEVDRHTRRVARQVRRARREAGRHSGRRTSAAHGAVAQTASRTATAREARVREILQRVQEGSLDIDQADRLLDALPRP
jgi:anti-sigma28 factor (negative regulator of flagellin synthesis)